MEILNRLFYLLRSGFAEISSWLVLFVTLFITLDVALRYFFQASVPAGMEFTQVFLAILVFFAFGKAQESKVHIRVEFVIEKLPPKVRHYWEVIVHVLALVFFSFIFWEAIGFFRDSYVMKEYYGGAVQVPIYPARGAIVIGCGLMMVELCRDIAFMLSKEGREAFVPSLEQREIDETLAKMEEEEKKGVGEK
jgi:TRAP-type C4-dicarboxylate transport system permease small subunit